MAITVNFRGPILFVHDGKTLIDVRIPDSRTETKHADNSKAVPHFAGIMILRGGGGAPHYVELTDKRTLRIEEDGATDPPDVRSNFLDKVALEQLVSADVHNGQELKLDDVSSGDTLVRIFLFGGKLSTGKLTSEKFDVPYKLGHATKKVALPLLTTWTCKKKATITGAEETIELENDDVVYIYNWEDARPTKKALEWPMRSTIGLPMQPESDFKWVYKMLVPPNTWADWLAANTADGSLPAPYSEIAYAAQVFDQNLFPPNSACDGSIWKEPP